MRLTQNNNRGRLPALTINRVTRRPAGAGSWVVGRINSYDFEALVFPEAADHPEWEVVAGCRVSKLWITLNDEQTVYSWDRGLDRPAADARVRAVVDYLAGVLADRVFATNSPATHPADVDGVEYPSARAAVRHRSVGRRAILLEGRNWVVTAAEADRLAAAGVSFAYLCEHVTPDGQYRIMTVPVN